MFSMELARRDGLEPTQSHSVKVLTETCMAFPIFVIKGQPKLDPHELGVPLKEEEGGANSPPARGI